MRKLNFSLSTALLLVLALAVTCGPAAPAPTATVTVTKTAPATPAPTVTVTKTAPAVTVTAPPVTVTVTPTPTPPKLVKVRHSAIVGATEQMLLTIGKEKGLFQKRGIDLEIEEMAAAAARVAMFTGAVDITGGDPTLFYDERKDTRIIGPHMNLHFSTIVRKDSPYQSYHDLRGKKMGTTSPAAAAWWMAFKTILNLEGLNMEKDFQLVNAEYTVQLGWLLKGEVEAINVAEPFATKFLLAERDKLRQLYWVNDLYKKHTGTSWIWGGVYTLAGFVKNNPDLAREYGRAFDDTLSYMYANLQPWKSDVVVKGWKVESPEVLELLSQKMPETIANPRYGPAYKEALIKRNQLIAKAGLIPQEVVEWFKGIILFAEPW